MGSLQGQTQSWTLGGHYPELDFGGHKCHFHVKSFLTLLFTIGNIAIWGPCPPNLPLECYTGVKNDNEHDDDDGDDENCGNDSAS